MAGAGVETGVASWNGLLNVNKSAGWTSHDVVAKLRGLLRVGKIGHAGTLDPAATGVLPVLVGKATRIAEYLVDWDKEYRAVLRLGETTDTQDATGQVLQRRSVGRLTEETMRSVIGRFQGPVAQLPPMYSAVKVEGVPLYKAARAGRTVERGVRQVVIHEIQVTGIVGCEVSLRIVCSKGTYIRTLCADIGEALGVGGHLRSLERQRVGCLTLGNALSIEAIQSRLAVGRLSEALVSLDAALAALPAVIVDAETATRVVHGVPVPLEALEQRRAAEPTHTGPVRIKDQAGRLLAIGRIPSGEVAPLPYGSARMAIVKVLADPQGGLN
jgi:tRNA pseudouridine55 synthase